jgi:hypothetical protein
VIFLFSHFIFPLALPQLISTLLFLIHPTKGGIFLSLLTANLLLRYFRAKSNEEEGLFNIVFNGNEILRLLHADSCRNFIVCVIKSFFYFREREGGETTILR